MAEALAESFPSPRAKPPRARIDWKQALTGYLFIAPALVGFSVFFLLPAIRAIYISFTDWNLLSDPDWVGFDNYRRLYDDPLFWNAVRVTAKYVAWNVPIQTIVGLFLANAMFRVTRSLVLRTTLILPYLLSNITAALIWSWLLDPQQSVPRPEMPTQRS